MTILFGWQEQYDRMIRSYRQLLAVSQGEKEASSDDARDVLFHFFQDAFHLRDWLRHDRVLAWPQDWHDLTDGESVLALCADLANGTKHFELSPGKAWTRDETTAFMRQDVIVRPPIVGSGEPVQPSFHAWYVTSGGKQRNAVELAGEVVDAWDAWLREKGQSPRTSRY